MQFFCAVDYDSSGGLSLGEFQSGLEKRNYPGCTKRVCWVAWKRLQAQEKWGKLACELVRL